MAAHPPQQQTGYPATNDPATQGYDAKPGGYPTQPASAGYPQQPPSYQPYPTQAAPSPGFNVQQGAQTTVSHHKIDMMPHFKNMMYMNDIRDFQFSVRQ